MIRSWFGLSKTPFATDEIVLLPHQQYVFDILSVHCRQGGLCLLLGEPGVGKSCIKQVFHKQADKQHVVVSIGRTLHTYRNIIKQLCQAFSIDADGSDFHCEKRLIEEAFILYRQGRSLITIIDDAHFADISILRKLRLMFGEFPPNHNLILIGRSCLIEYLSFKSNEDIKSRITYSANLTQIPFDDMEQFIYAEMDKAGLGHHIFSPESLGLIIRSADGILRRAKNLCISCLLETVRAQKKEVTLDVVNLVLMQPHWRMEAEVPSHLLGVS